MRLLHRVVHAINHVHVAVDGHAVRHVAQARLVRIHEVRAGLILFFIIPVRILIGRRGVVVNNGLAKCNAVPLHASKVDFNHGVVLSRVLVFVLL